MHYPCNYGYVPRAIAEDGDPLDVLLFTPFALAPGVGVRCRSLGMLRMEDERGADCKILAVPDERVLPMYAQWRGYDDLQPERLHQIQHFFEHYKDLEPGKWVRVIGWIGAEQARRARGKPAAPCGELAGGSVTALLTSA